MTAAAVPASARAGFGVRLVAVLADTAVLIVAGAVIGTFLQPSARNGLGIVLGAAYYTWYEGTRDGQTLGKQLVGIRVVDRSTGLPPEPMSAFIRYVVSLLSAVPCLLGYLWMLWDADNDTWHDKLSQTAVIRAARPDDGADDDADVIDVRDDDGLWGHDPR